MPTYRRNYVPGGTYFFTVVTCERRPILTSELARKSLRTAIDEERRVRTFEIVAVVLLPDHLHTLWTLPAGDQNYPTRWRRIKERFSTLFLSGGGPEARRTSSRQKRAERGVWQRRFWEHTVRDEDDLKRCLDYIHYNPVKHGHAERVRDYPWSSFHRWAKTGEYELSWGAAEAADVPGAEWE